MLQVKVINIEPTKDNKIKAIATIQIPHIVTIHGIKVMQGDRTLYCHAPTQSYWQNGVKKWSHVVVFEQEIWNVIQRKIIEEYKKLKEANQ